MSDKDTIYRQAAIDVIEQKAYRHTYIEQIIDIINGLPSAQPERKTGHWIKTARWGRVYYCDQCRNYLDFDGVNVGRGSTNFCPNCGAHMRGEQDGNQEEGS